MTDNWRLSRRKAIGSLGRKHGLRAERGLRGYRASQEIWSNDRICCAVLVAYGRSLDRPRRSATLPALRAIFMRRTGVHGEAAATDQSLTESRQPHRVAPAQPRSRATVAASRAPAGAVGPPTALDLLRSGRALRTRARGAAAPRLPAARPTCSSRCCGSTPRKRSCTSACGST